MYGLISTVTTSSDPDAGRRAFAAVVFVAALIGSAWVVNLSVDALGFVGSGYLTVAVLALAKWGVAMAIAGLVMIVPIGAVLESAEKHAEEQTRLFPLSYLAIPAWAPAPHIPSPSVRGLFRPPRSQS